jgi:hypothetical protein
MKLRALRPRAYIAMGSALVLLLASAVAARALTPEEGLHPEVTVTAFYAALRARDGATAYTYLAPNGREDPFADKAKLPDPSELIKGDGYDPPTDVRILAVHTKKDRGQASITFRLAGMPQPIQQLNLIKIEDGGAGKRRGWLIDGGMPMLQVTGQGASSATVNGVALPPGVEIATVFPGRYQVGLADHPLLEAEPEPVFAGFGPSRPSTVPVRTARSTPANAIWTGEVPHLEVGVKQHIKAAVRAKVRSYVDGCARRAEVSPAHCPFNATSLGAIRKITWSIISYPVIAVELSSSATLYVYTTTSGQADAAGVHADGRPLRSRVAFTVAGTVSIFDGRISFIPAA